MKTEQKGIQIIGVGVLRREFTRTEMAPVEMGADIT